MRINEIAPRGIDTAPLGLPEGGAEDIVNLRYDLFLKAWTADRTLIPLVDPDTGVSYPDADCWSVFSYRPGNSYKEHILFEQDDGAGKLDLKVLIGQTTYTLKTGRHKPLSNEPTTIYVPYGDTIFIFNGYDTPLVYFGGRYIREVFANIPSAPSLATPLQANAGWGPEQIGLFVRETRTSAGYISQFSEQSGYGLGLGSMAIPYFDGSNQNFYAEQIPNTYEWVISFITDTGSESSFSPRSSRASWLGSGIDYDDDDSPKTNHKNLTARYGVELTGLPLGPPGTLKRRIYRTKNQGGVAISGNSVGGAGSDLYFAFDINDNTTVRVTDALPDTQLGSEALVGFERQPFPLGNLAATYAGRLVIAGVKDQPGLIYVSDTNQPESFSARNIYSVSTGYGGNVTALYPYNNLLLIFREFSIDALIQTQTGFQIVPIIRNVGSLSPHSIKSIQGFGTMFLASDRSFYLISGNYSGGSSIQVQNASVKLGTKILEINESCLQRAFAVYNPKDQEYWCHLPTKGADVALEGFVFHAPTAGWSRRKEMPLAASTVTLEGLTLFATVYDHWTTIEGDPEAPRGLEVWSGLTELAPTVTDAYYETPWLSLGNPEALKRISNIFVYGYKNEYDGSNHSIYAAVDYKPYPRLLESGDFVNTEVNHPGILDTAVVDGGPIAEMQNWDQNFYSSREVVTVRVAPQVSPDIGYWENVTDPSATDFMSAANGGVRWVKFRFMAAPPKDFRFLGYSVEFTINGKTLQYSSLE